MSSDCCADKGRELEQLALHDAQKRVLLVVLSINATMFVLEFGAGLIAGSAALMADSADMFGDAIVYGLSLYALSRSGRWKAGLAMAKGGFILLLCLGVLVDIAVKVGSGVPPSSTLMLIFGGLALSANLICVRLLWQFRAQDVNMSSTFECSRNDVLSNIGVLIAAGAVVWFQSPWPDIIVGVVIAFILLRSSIRVIGSAWPKLRVA